jgi:hypothetical protein
MLIAKTGQESYDSGWLAQNEYASGGTLYNLLDPRVVAQIQASLVRLFVWLKKRNAKATMQTAREHISFGIMCGL